MAKDPKIKCCICKAKHRQSFMTPLENVWSGHACEACTVEYRQIFHGYQNRQARKPRKNTMFEAFEKGWLEEEAKYGLEHRPIPEGVKRYYDKLLFEFGAFPREEEILKLINDDVETKHKFNKIKRIDDERISEDS